MLCFLTARKLNPGSFEQFREAGSRTTGIPASCAPTTCATSTHR